MMPLPKVSKVQFWMQLMGSASAKRSVVFANALWIQQLDLGKLTKATRERLTTIKPTRTDPNEHACSIYNAIARIQKLSVRILRQLCPQWFPEISWNIPAEANRVGFSDLFVMYGWVVPPLPCPRSYPRGFGLQLLHSYEARTDEKGPLRFKATVNPRKSDRMIFQEMPLGDCWIEPKIHLAWAYLYRSKHLKVPDSWHDSIHQFNKELMERAL